MKKLFVSAVIVVAFISYFWFQQQSLLAVDIIPNISTAPTKTPAITPIPTADSTMLPVAGGTTAPTARPTATPTPTPQVSGFKNGTYTSQVSNVYGHGNLQFQVVIQGGKISDIQFLQYPTNGSTSRQISNYSLPILRQEAIQAQSANVDGVTQATETSEVFAQVLNALLSGIKV